MSKLKTPNRVPSIAPILKAMVWVALTTALVSWLAFDLIHKAFELAYPHVTEVIRRGR